MGRGGRSVVWLLPVSHKRIQRGHCGHFRAERRRGIASGKPCGGYGAQLVIIRACRVYVYDGVIYCVA
ncbi:hypothetical protein D3C75_371800 [compost metagenome]